MFSPENKLLGDINRNNNDVQLKDIDTSFKTFIQGG